MLGSHWDVPEFILHVFFYNNALPACVDDELQNFLEGCVPHLANAIRNVVVHRLATRMWEVVDSFPAAVKFWDQAQWRVDKQAAGLVHQCHTAWGQVFLEFFPDDRRVFQGWRQVVWKYESFGAFVFQLYPES